MRATDVFFGAEIEDLSDRQLVEIFADVPSCQLPKARLSGEGILVIDALVEAGLAKSKGEARRLIAENGLRLDGELLTDPQGMVSIRTGQIFQR